MSTDDDSPPIEYGSHDFWKAWVDAVSAEPGVCDDYLEPHSHGGFCMNWRPTYDALKESEG